MKKMIQCRACGEQLPPRARVCPSCGKKQKKPLAARLFGWFVILFVISAFAGIMLAVPSESQPGARSTSKLGKVMGLTRGQEEQVLDVFARCGIGPVDSVETFQEGENRTSYYVEDDETKAYGGADYTIVVWLENTSKEVREIYFHDEDIYMDGKVLAKVSDFYVSREDRDKYRVSAQMLVNELLLVPDSAEYPALSGWSFGMEGGVVVVQSTVTSKNAFGVEVKNKFQVKFQNENPISLILDGTEYIK